MEATRVANGTAVSDVGCREQGRGALIRGPCQHALAQRVSSERKEMGMCLGAADDALEPTTTQLPDIDL